MNRYGDDTYRRTKLANGLRVVTESMPQVRSLAVGVWFDVGSRDEPERLAGISHFLEHMNFKGTKRRSAVSIVREIEGRGGHLNAFTSREVTCYYARIIDSHLTRAVDVLADITQHSIFDQTELDKERAVILEELKNIEDTPDEWVFERFLEQMFNRHPMGRSVIGYRESLNSADSRMLQDYRDRNYTASNIVLAAAGNLKHEQLVKLAESRFATAARRRSGRQAPRPAKRGDHRQDIHTSTQQAHICWGCRALRFDDPRRFVLLAMNNLLGGGMSSRLFQQIREKRGLAYSVYSFAESYQDTGIFGVYAGTDPKQAEKALKLITRMVEDLSDKTVPESELKRTKDSLKGNILLSLESPNARMNRLARMEMSTIKWQTLDEVVAEIEAVTPRQIKQLAGELIRDQARFTTILWPKKND